MQKTPLSFRLLFLSFIVGSFTLFSCKKEAVSTPQSSLSNAAVPADNANGTAEIATSTSHFGVLGTYFNRGSRTLFKGKAGVDNAILSLDYFNEKKVVPTFDTKSLVCGYGETNFVKQGWQYIIRYDFKKGEITLAPNGVMAAAIQPNLFKTLTATYDATTKTFNFMTRFTDMNGNENEVFDVMTKE